jgi:hypothetical protein
MLMLNGINVGRGETTEPYVEVRRGKKFGSLARHADSLVRKFVLIGYYKGNENNDAH